MSALFFLEPLESRQLLSGTPLALSGGTGSDLFYIRMTSPTTVGLWVSSSTGVGNPTQSFSPSQFSAIQLSGTGKDASLSVDLSGGQPALSGGISWNGGAAQGPLSVIGNSGSNSVTLAAGQVTWNTLPITFSNSASLTVSTGAGNDAVTMSAQPAAVVQLTGGAGTDSLSAQSGIITVAPPSGVNVMSLSSVVIGATANVQLSRFSAASARAVVVVSSLSIANGGKVDVGTDDLIVKSGNVAQISAWITSAQDSADGNDWVGSGITSSIAVADISRQARVGMLLNSDGAGHTLYGTGAPLGLFDGYSPESTDVLVAATVAGDASLDGKVDGNDFTLIDNGFNSGKTGWSNGDFNNDGVINGDDFTLIDSGYNQQSVRSSAYTISSPLQIPGLVAWYTATAGVTTSAGVVTRWADLSGNGNDLLPASGSQQPVFDSLHNAVQFPFSTTPVLLSTAGSLTVDRRNVSVFTAVRTENMGNDYQTGTSPVVQVLQGLVLQAEVGDGKWHLGDNASFGEEAISAAPVGNQESVIGGESNGLSGTQLFTNGMASSNSIPALAGSVTTPLTLGSTANHMFGSISDVALFNRSLTAVENAEMNVYLAARNNVNFTPTTNVVIDGDSISFGINQAGNTVNWADNTPILQSNEYKNFAHFGRHLTQIDPSTGQSDFANVLNSFAGFDPAAENNVYFVFGGTNDIFTGSLNAQQTFDQLKALCLGAKAYGLAHGIVVKTVVATCLHRGTASDQTGFNSVADQYNALIRADKSGAFDAIADVAAAAQFQNADNLTYIGPDGIHPTLAGMQVIASIADPAIVSVLG